MSWKITRSSGAAWKLFLKLLRLVAFMLLYSLALQMLPKILLPLPQRKTFVFIMEFHFQSRLPVLCLRKVQHMFHSLPSLGCKLVGPNEQTHRLLGIQILQCLALSSFHRTFSSSDVWLFFPSSQPSVIFMFCSFFLPKKP